MDSMLINNSIGIDTLDYYFISLNKKDMKKETVIVDGYKFHRYPNSQKPSDRHYYKGWIDINGNWHKISLHRYIWEKVNGKIPNGLVIHHINGDFADNRIDNLQLIGFSEHLSNHYKSSPQSFKDSKVKILNDKARPKAVEWHKSAEGHEWHKKQSYTLVWNTISTIFCKECGMGIEINGRARNICFCSAKCKSRFHARIWRKKHNG